jgi:hypothetical protein
VIGENGRLLDKNVVKTIEYFWPEPIKHFSCNVCCYISCRIDKLDTLLIPN